MSFFFSQEMSIYLIAMFQHLCIDEENNFFGDIGIWSPARSSLRITVPSSRQVRKLSGCVSRYFVRTAGAAALISSSKLSLLNTLRANSRFSSFNAFLVISSIPSTCFSISSIRRLWSSSLSSTVSSLLTTKRAMPSAKSPKTLQITVYLEHGQHKTQVNGYRIV